MAFQTWKTLGPAKPPALMKAEQVLWDFLWDCAAGTCHPVAGLQSALKKAAEVSSDATESDWAWFYPSIAPNPSTSNISSVHELPTNAPRPPPIPTTSSTCGDVQGSSRVDTAQSGNSQGSSHTDTVQSGHNQGLSHTDTAQSGHNQGSSQVDTTQSRNSQSSSQADTAPSGNGQRSSRQPDAAQSGASNLPSQQSASRPQSSSANIAPPPPIRETRSTAAKQAALAAKSSKPPPPSRPVKPRRNPNHRKAPPKPSQTVQSAKRVGSSNVLKKICYSEMRLLQESSVSFILS
jgi:hypothetical protein